MEQFTLLQYIANPLGDSTVTHRELYRNLYMTTLDKILEKRNQEKIKYHIYKTNDEKYYIHFKIPSESVTDVYYDTVIYFYYTEDIVKNSRNIKDYYVKFFSNDAMFNFVYTYTFNKKGILIPELKQKASQYALNTPPVSKNPNDNIGYIKSIYLSYLLIEKYGLFNKNVLNNYATTYNKNTLLTEVSSYDDKKQEYDLRKSAENNKKKNPDIARKLNKEADSYDSKSHNVDYITRIPVVKSATKKVETIPIGNIKRDKRIKKIKKR